MGGTDSARGNESQTAEFNFYADPEAAEIVLERFKETNLKVKLVTWECTIKNAITWEFYDKLCDQNKVEGFLMKECSKAMELFLRREGQESVSDYIIPDFVAAAVLIDESLVEKSKLVHASVELEGAKTRGMCVIDWDQLHCGKILNCQIIREINQEKMEKMLLSIFSSK